MALDLYNWSTNLFAYLYQRFESAEDTKNLPVRMEYQVSDTFNQKFGECQVRVNNIIRKKLDSVFKLNYLVVCSGIGTFRNYCERACWQLYRKFHLHTSVVCLSAVVIELNFYCFQQGCYRFALFAPECLNVILKRIFLKAISFRARDCSNFEIFEQMLKICGDMLEPEGAKPNSEHREVVKFGKRFAKREIERYERINKLHMDKLEEESEPSRDSEEGALDDGAKSDDSSEDKAEWGPPPKEDPYALEDSDENLLAAAAAKPLNANACRICHEENCKRYLEEFVRRFVAGETQYTPLE